MTNSREDLLDSHMVPIAAIAVYFSTMLMSFCFFCVLHVLLPIEFKGLDLSVETLGDAIFIGHKYAIHYGGLLGWNIHNFPL